MLNDRISRRSALQGAAAFAAASALPAGFNSASAAPVKINLGYTATLGFLSVFLAKETGIFAKNGLDVDLTLIALNSNIPAALVSNSVQVGGPTPSILLQANEGGLDLVVVAGCSAPDPTNDREGVMVRKDSAIMQPSDFIGKKVGVPGIGAFLHVLFRKWLSDKGVDFTKINFVETPFTSSVEALRSGNIDAVIAGAPYSVRILNEGGRVAAPIYSASPANMPAIVYATTRQWAAANQVAVKNFQRSLAEAVDAVKKDPASAKAHAAKYVKLPDEIMKSIEVPVMISAVDEAQMQWWVDVMSQQKMLDKKPDVSRLIVK